MNTVRQQCTVVVTQLSYC